MEIRRDKPRIAYRRSGLLSLFKTSPRLKGEEEYDNDGIHDKNDDDGNDDKMTKLMTKSMMISMTTTIKML